MYKVHKIDTKADGEYFEVFVENCDSRTEAFKAIAESGALDEIKECCDSARVYGLIEEDKLDRLEADIDNIKSETEIELQYLMADKVILAINKDNSYGAWYKIDSNGNKSADELDENIADLNEDIHNGAHTVTEIMLWGHYLEG